MLGHARKRPTEVVELLFRVQADKVDAARNAVAPFEVKEATIPWREALGVTDDEVPGRALRGSRFREGLTQKELSSLTGVPQRHISEMENGKRSISKAMAKRLGEALKVGYKVFL
ncbi:MAG: XRE family transcriptional regulator [Deltaproteobacteria bacterium HGW-Deltaproteobacteria-8]|nr:MAG: XRE family transcriptional regulator [Deltaproteobacteria bacterium HGW-Deltaproteobacteria-8]